MTAVTLNPSARFISPFDVTSVIFEKKYQIIHVAHYCVLPRMLAVSSPELLHIRCIEMQFCVLNGAFVLPVTSG